METQEIKERIIESLQNGITEDNLILDNLEEETQTTSCKTYYVSFDDKEIRVLRNITFNDNIGEVCDNWEFETNLNLTEEDEETIKSFCEEQDNQ